MNTTERKSRSYLIGGDSWGIGVFQHTNGVYGPTGQGIHSLLEQQGHSVVNISKGGGSNWLTIDRLYQRWNSRQHCSFGVDPRDRIDFTLSQFDAVVFFQTDAFREWHFYVSRKGEQGTQWKQLPEKFIESLLEYNSLESKFDDYFNEIYLELNNLGVPVLCVGGWSKLHPCIAKYPNLVPAVVSATQLLIPELKTDTYISDPEWFDQLSGHEKFMNRFGAEFKRLTIDATEKLSLIYSNWHEVHPNIGGYSKILQEILVKEKINFS